MILFGRLLFKYGILQGFWLFLKIKFSNGSLKIPSIKHKVWFRKNTSDFTVLHAIFFADSYDIKLKFTPSFIIDAGANVGYGSIVFANKYPTATIIAIEPDDENFALLEKNTKPYPNIHCLKTGLWPRNCKLKITNSDASKWAFTVAELPASSAEGFPAITITDLMKRYGFAEIDVLKMDIEGSEKEVFEEGAEAWLPNTKCVIVEVHDGFKKGSSRAVFKAISQYEFSFKRRGENLIFIRDN